VSVTFRSAAGADVLMLQADADTLLRALGREPSAEGVFMPAQISSALAAFDSAAMAQGPDPISQPDSDAGEGDDAEAPEPAIPLRRRAWPVLELLRRALQADKPVVWTRS
jgi:hypothetical protein